MGWIAYTAAFAIGGGIGIYKYRYAPGGRRDRELEADRQRQEEAAREAMEENRIREERRKERLLSAAQLSPDNGVSSSSKGEQRATPSMPDKELKDQRASC